MSHLKILCYLLFSVLIYFKVLYCQNVLSCSVVSDSFWPHSRPAGSSVYGILQAKILEWLPCCPPEDLPNPRTESRSPSLQADSLFPEPPGKLSEYILILRDRVLESSWLYAELSSWLLFWQLRASNLVGASLVTQIVKNLSAMWESWVWVLVLEDPLEKGIATHSSILAWIIPWKEKLGGLQSMGSQRVRHNWVTNTFKCFSVA